MPSNTNSIGQYPPLIEAKGVSKKFALKFSDSRRYGIRDFTRIALGVKRNNSLLSQGEFWALEDVSFTVNRGESMAILGRNGAGKSTLLTMMTGRMLPDTGSLTVRAIVTASSAVVANPLPGTGMP